MKISSTSVADSRLLSKIGEGPPVKPSGLAKLLSKIGSEGPTVPF
ncbi:MAG: hypothetical protein WAU90_02825 [Methyloceanibacter sp.]